MKTIAQLSTYDTATTYISTMRIYILTLRDNFTTCPDYWGDIGKSIGQTGK